MMIVLMMTAMTTTIFCRPPKKQHCKVIGTTVARELFLHQQPRLSYAGPLETLLDLSAMLTPTHCDSNSLKEGGCDNYGTLTLFMP